MNQTLKEKAYIVFKIVGERFDAAILDGDKNRAGLVAAQDDALHKLCGTEMIKEFQEREQLEREVNL